ncbi:MAG: translation initiation factor IF-2 [FCB group bacterium]|nr:translation initiation factor IF-2 [FCB group bacterium]
MGSRPIRIFQIAKELNISHTEILSFLKSEGIDIASHMSPVDEVIHQRILTEFSKDKETVDRMRKEQVRREIHDSRVRQEQKSKTTFKLLSLEEQRSIEKREAEEKRKREEEERQRKLIESQQAEEERKKAKALAEEKKKRAELEAAEEKKKREEAERKKKEEEKSAKISSKKRKLRKIDLSEIQPGSGTSARPSRSKGRAEKDSKSQKSVQERVRQTLSRLEKKPKKKSYRKSHTDRSAETVSTEGFPVIEIPEFASVDELAKLFSVSPSDVIQKCFNLGILATINQRLEWDTIELLAMDYEYQAAKQTDVGEEIFSLAESEEDIEKAKFRAPVVTVMGHVDHGKTSLLDYIRSANVVAGESGGITQHIGAYRVNLDNGQSITFLDTPGHEAFTAMRARGAQITDIVVLVVAADDSVMPQTIEAINHAKAAGSPIIVAINKIDKPGADIDKVKRELSDHGVLVEDWGGKVQSVPVSAKTGEGIDDLLNSILAEAEVMELKANYDTLARGTVVDSRLDKGHGPMATVLIQKGTLHVGDPFMCSDYSGKVRAIMNERSQRIQKAEPSDAVQILGFGQVPQAADIFAVVENERELKRISGERQRISREIAQKKILAHSLDAMSAQIKKGTIKQLPLIIKGDVDGSVEAVSESLQKLNTEEVGVNIIHKSVGMISEGDVLLAEASKAVIIGFNVQVGANAKLQAKQAGVEIRNYKIIYNALEDIKLALEGLLEPEEVEEIHGRALVQAQFKIPKIGFIAGAKVVEGHITRNLIARLIRDNEVLIDHTTISSLKRFKDDVREVKEGLECGIGLEGVNKYSEGDEIVAYEIKKIKRTLAQS